MSDNNNQERRNYDKDISVLFDKLDQHFREEVKFRQEFNNRVSGIEYNIESMNGYIQRVTEILERITIIEERDKSHNKLIEDITGILRSMEKQIQDHKEEAQKKISVVDKKVDKWVYTFSGAGAVLVVIWAIIGNSFDRSLTDIQHLTDKVKIHLEVDKPTGWPTK